MPITMDSFLLLPGDGMLLLDGSRTVCHADPAALARLFRTDDGVGVGLLADLDDRAGHGPSKVLYDRVLRSIGEAVVVTTAEPFDGPGPITVYVNDEFVRHTGYSRTEAIGRSPRMLQGPATELAPRAQFRAAMAAWRHATVEILNYTKAGTPFWVEIDMFPVADETGWFTHWVSMQRDVSERHAREADRKARDAVVQTVLDSMPGQIAILDGSGSILAVNDAWRPRR